MTRQSALLLALALSLGGCGPAAAAGEAWRIDAKPGEGLLAVRDRVRAWRAAAPERANAEVEVRLPAGRHVLREPLALGAADSHTRWRGEPGAEVRITGGARIAAKPSPVTDAATLARLPEGVRGRVVEYDLSAAGVGDYGDYLHNAEHGISQRVASTWNQGEYVMGSFAPPKGASANGRIDVFFNDVPLQVARTPKDVQLHVEKLLGNVRGTGPTGKNPTAKEGVFTYREDRPARWAGEPDPHVCGCWNHDWAEQHQRVARLDPATKTMELSKPWHQYEYHAGTRFYGFNLLCELDEPGEYFIDRRRDRLVLLPPAPVEGAEVWLSNAPRLVEMRGATDVAFEGLTFEQCRNSAFWLKDCTNCVIRNSTIRNLGQHAAVIEDGRGCGVSGCAMHGMGGGGVWLADANRDTLVASGHFVEGCDVHDYGRWNRMYRPAVCLAGVGMRVTGNFIHDAPHAAVLFFGCDHLMASNEVARVCRESKDCGAFYTGRSWLLRGNRIVGNHFHDIIGLDGNYTRTIYLDDSMACAEVVGNRFERCTWCLFIGGSRENAIVGNRFEDCPHAIYMDARAKNWQKPHLDRRIAAFRKARTHLKPPYATRYPALAKVLDGDPYLPQGNVITNNAFVRGKAEWIGRYGAKGLADSPDWWFQWQIPGAFREDVLERLNTIRDNRIDNAGLGGWEPSVKAELDALIAAHRGDASAYAVFDFDHTLALGDSSYVCLWHILEHRDYRGGDMARIMSEGIPAELRPQVEAIFAAPDGVTAARRFWPLYRKLWNGEGDAFACEWRSRLFSGYSPAALTELARTAMRENLRRVGHRRDANVPTERRGFVIIPEVVRLVRDLRDAGIAVYVVSGSRTEPLKVATGPEFGFGIDPSCVFGCDSGVVAGQKTAFIRERIAVRHGGRDPVLAVGDSMGDYGMFTELPGVEKALVFRRKNGRPVDAPLRRLIDEAPGPGRKYLIQGRDEPNGRLVPSHESIFD